MMRRTIRFHVALKDVDVGQDSIISSSFKAIQCSVLPEPEANLLTSLWLESRDGERHGFGNVAKLEQNTFIIAGCGQRRVY